MADQITSQAIDLNEAVTIAELRSRAGVPEWLGDNEVTIGYAGCGSHGVELTWLERFQAFHYSAVKAGWRVEYPDFEGTLTEDAEIVDGNEVLLTIGDKQIRLGSMTLTGGAGGTPFVNAATPRPTDA